MKAWPGTIDCWHWWIPAGALNRRGEQYIGRSFTLQGPIVNGVGVLRVDDTSWRISGNDLPDGTPVTVTGTDGVILKVERNTN